MSEHSTLLDYVRKDLEATYQYFSTTPEANSPSARNAFFAEADRVAADVAEATEKEKAVRRESGPTQGPNGRWWQHRPSGGSS